MPRDTRPIDLPAGVLDRVERRVERTEFDSAAAYVTFVLEEVLAEVEAESERERAEREPADRDGIDEADIEERLKSLGYLDS